MRGPHEFASAKNTPSPLRALVRLAARATMAVLLAAIASAAALPVGAQSDTLPIGRIEGDDIAVRGDVQVVREHGSAYTSLLSGAQVTVRSGTARIELTRGGEIGICGPARFSLVRAGSSLTLALDYGHVRARVDASEDFHIYTPAIQASSISPAGHAGDISVGLAENGKMCVHPAAGALRLEPQFGGDNIVVPQGVGATIEEGKLASLSEGGATCGCDALSSRPKAPSVETGPQARVALNPDAAATSAAAKDASAPPAAPAAPLEQPIWKVYMPPLSYDASAPNGDPTAARASSMPPPSAETALLFREVYAEPVIRLSGEVEAGKGKGNAKPAGDSAQAASTNASQEQKKPTLAARIGNFLRRLFGGKPKPQDQGAPPQTAAT